MNKKEAKKQAIELMAAGKEIPKELQVILFAPSKPRGELKFNLHKHMAEKKLRLETLEIGAAKELLQLCLADEDKRIARAKERRAEKKAKAAAAASK